MINIHTKYFKNSASSQNVDCKRAEISEKLEWEAQNTLEQGALEAMDEFVQSKEMCQHFPFLIYRI